MIVIPSNHVGRPKTGSASGSAAQATPFIDMHARYVLAAGAMTMAIAVVLGAFGAHALKASLSTEALSIWQTAVQYHAWHALGLLGVGLWLQHSPTQRALRIAGWLLAAGIVLFSGSLYALVLTGQRWLGAITPVGGVAWIAAWVMLAVSALRGGVK